MWGLPRGRKSPSGFSPSSTAEEVTAGIDGSGLVAIVTGHLRNQFYSASFSSRICLSIPSVTLDLFLLIID
jgi:hypothetical protein